MSIGPRHLLMVVVALAACGRTEKPEPGKSSTTTARTTDTVVSNRQFPGIAKFPETRAYLDTLGKDSVEVMKRKIESHTGRMRELVDAISIDMTNLNMDPPETWIALMDSVGTELDRLPKFAVDSLKKKMISHVGRVKRLMNAHEEILETMGGY